MNFYMLFSVMFTIASCAFIVLAWRFWRLKDTVIVSISEMGDLMCLLVAYDQLEKPEEQLARMLKMTSDEVLTEIKKGHLMKLIGMKASAILERLKTAVPDAKVCLKPIEVEYEMLEEKR